VPFSGLNWEETPLSFEELIPAKRFTIEKEFTNGCPVSHTYNPSYLGD
jgi:hypothetical protein